jgi:hypothetical protein
MEDLIPLLIIILISIVGAVSRKKRRNVSESESYSPPVQSREKDDIFSWLEQVTDEEPDFEHAVSEPFFLDKGEAKKVKVPVVVEPVNNKYSSFTGFVSDENPFSKEGERSVDIKTYAKKGMQRNAIKDVSLHQTAKIATISKSKPKHEFDLKKAVIYSELLNRKYS